jgi:hypothetical protein
MSNGQACFQIGIETEIEDRTPSGAVETSPPTSGVRDTESTIHVVGGRGAAVTVPGAGVDRFAATMPVVEESAAAPPLAWCVDLGAKMITRTTFELWTGIEQGEIRGRMLVWREGMECWTPVERVGELACALELAPRETLEPSLEPAEATTSPALREAPPEPPPPRISSRRQVPARGGGKWIALGSAVAASAISAAALTTLLAQPPALEPHGSREPASASALQGAATSSELPAVIESETERESESKSAPAAAPAKGRHDDRGQHRRRSGDHR